MSLPTACTGTWGGGGHRGQEGEGQTRMRTAAARALGAIAPVFVGSPKGLLRRGIHSPRERLYPHPITSHALNVLKWKVPQRRIPAGSRRPAGLIRASMIVIPARLRVGQCPHTRFNRATATVVVCVTRRVIVLAVVGSVIKRHHPPQSSSPGIHAANAFSSYGPRFILAHWWGSRNPDKSLGAAHSRSTKTPVIHAAAVPSAVPGDQSAPECGRGHQQREG